MRTAALALAAAFLAYGGYGGSAPPKDDRLARQTIDNLRRGNLNAVRKHFDPEQLGANPEQSLRKFHEYIDHAEPKSVELVGCNVVKGPAGTRTALTYEIAFPASWYVATVVVHSKDDSRQVMGLHLNRLAGPPEELNAFTFKGKAGVHYVFVAAAAAMPVCTVVAVILCLRTPVRRKWLWILFILVGFGSLSLNWTTGELQFQLLSARLLSAGCLRAGTYAPWVVSVSFPLGVVVFLLRRRALRQSPPPTSAAAPPPSAPPGPDAPPGG